MIYISSQPSGFSCKFVRECGFWKEPPRYPKCAKHFLCMTLRRSIWGRRNWLWFRRGLEVDQRVSQTYQLNIHILRFFVVQWAWIVPCNWSCQPQAALSTSRAFSMSCLQKDLWEEELQEEDLTKTRIPLYKRYKSLQFCFYWSSLIPARCPASTLS